MVRGSVLIAVLALVGCERREVPPARATADDSAALRPDSTARDSTSGDSIIGYDSAFGPILTIDSAGNVVEIPPRRP